MIDISQAMQIIRDGGVIAVLVAILVGGFRQWWVFGWQYDQVVKDRDEWKHVALKGLELTEKATDAATTKIV